MSTRAMAFLATKDAPASRRFYEEVLGLRFVEEHDFAIVFDAFGTMLRIQKTPEVTVAPYTAFGLDVDDIASALQALTDKGVRVKRYAGFDQDAQGIWTAPGGTKVCWFEDPDGHVLSLSEFP